MYFGNDVVVMRIGDKQSDRLVIPANLSNFTVNSNQTWTWSVFLQVSSKQMNYSWNWASFLTTSCVCLVRCSDGGLCP